MSEKCKVCGRFEDTRMGVCFDCATAGEVRAAKRSVEEHLRQGLEKLESGDAFWAKYDFQWALERLTGTGDYAPGGEFDAQGIDWRGQ